MKKSSDEALLRELCCREDLYLVCLYRAIHMNAAEGRLDTLSELCLLYSNGAFAPFVQWCQLAWVYYYIHQMSPSTSRAVALRVLRDSPVYSLFSVMSILQPAAVSYSLADALFNPAASLFSSSLSLSSCPRPSSVTAL